MNNPEVVFLSPHFDDVVLSCSAQLLAHPGSVVATLCSAIPNTNFGPSAWDRQSGFSSALEATVIRQLEDKRALHVLSAEQRLLGFFDGVYTTLNDFHEDPAQHRSIPHAFDRLHAMEQAIGFFIDELEPRRCAFPLGLFSDDHLITRRAALLALAARPWCTSYVYLDMPYALFHQSVVTAQLEWLEATQVFTDMSAIDFSLKHEAVSMYRSQFAPLMLEFGDSWPDIFRPGTEAMYFMTPTRVAECAQKIEQVT